MAAFGRYYRAEVVTLPFPYSDLSNAKIRPAVILASLVPAGDYILCQITSQSTHDPDGIVLIDDDFATGSLKKISIVRPGRLFTAHESTFLGSVGTLKEERFQVIVDTAVDILQRG